MEATPVARQKKREKCVKITEECQCDTTVGN